MVNGPSDQQRTVILGRTGSGKTFFACYLLSSRNFDEMPWVIIDYKGDSLVERIVKQNKIPSISVQHAPPKKPGLYYMRATPKIDDEAMEAWLWKAWRQEDIGLYVDEGYVLPSKEAFDVILTQGRSKCIPVIILYQRPVWMSRFAVAQADFFAVFDQNDERDLKTTQSFIKPSKGPNGERIDVYTELPKHYCLWYDVSQGVTNILTPCPPAKEILQAFKERLSKRKKADDLSAEAKAKAERIYLYA